MNVFGPGPDTAERTDVHNAPRSLFFHLLRAFLAAEESRFQIDIMNEIPICFGDFQRIEARKPGGIVHQIPKRTKLFPNFREQTPDLGNAR